MQEIITAKDARGRTLLVYAAKAGVVGIFTTVLNELRQCKQLSAEEVMTAFPLPLDRTVESVNACDVRGI